MPGPKMGPRPPDFDEQLIRQSPTFVKWEGMKEGEKLRYACREFIKGQGDDEERLMRRIMIARRNNIKDHQILKRARRISSSKDPEEEGKETTANVNVDQQEPPAKSAKTEHSLSPSSHGTSGQRKRRSANHFSDSEVADEMDVAAVEATRSFRKWKELKDGEVFVYNQKYVKGKDNHEWLLKKNIWRRMRYRRENKKMVEKLKEGEPPPAASSDNHASKVRDGSSSIASQIVDSALLSSAGTSGQELIMETSKNGEGVSTAAEDMSEAVEAAVKVAESYTKSAQYNNSTIVHNPLDTAANSAALDAAARLAAQSQASGSIDEEALAAAAAASSVTI